MQRFLLVCLAGGLGAGTRYLVNLAAERVTHFPLATLLVNLVGCLLMGALMQVALQTTTLSPTLRLVLGTGFLGGLTTYSSFNQEMLRMLDGGQHGRLAVYLAATLLGCLAMGVVGMVAARRLA
jgi:fluoride exporter